MAALPEPWKSLRASLEKLSERVKRLENRSPFFGTGISPTGNGGMESDDFDGDLDAGNAGTKGWAFNSVRVAIGELLLRPGSIGNDALTNPVVTGVGRASASNFGLTAGTLAEIAGINLTVPPGCTHLLAVCSTRLYAVNPNTTGGSDGTGADSWYTIPKLGSLSSVATPDPVSGGGGFKTTTCSDSFDITGLTPGSTIRLAVYGASAYQNVAANSANYACIAAGLTWLRS